MIVYLITNTINGKYYVGQTTRTFEDRWAEHRVEVNKGSKWLLTNAIRKYGAEVFTHEILGYASNQVELDNLEKLWILTLGSYDIEVGYNMSYGGFGNGASYLAGKNYEEIYGPERAGELKQAASRRRKGKTHVEIVGDTEKAKAWATKFREKMLGHPGWNKQRTRTSFVKGQTPRNKHLTLVELIGEQRAKDVKSRLAEAAKLTHTGRKRSVETRTKQSLAAKERENRKRLLRMKPSPEPVKQELTTLPILTGDSFNA